VSPSDLELVRIGRTGRRMRFGLVAVALLVVVAVLKPWPSQILPPRTVASSAGQFVAGRSAGAPSATTTSSSRATPLCADPGSWQVIVDDVELDRTVRTWVVAAAEYSALPPLRATVPVTAFVSKAVDGLGFCAPAAGLSGAATAGWSGTLWRVGSATAEAAKWQSVARLDPSPGSQGAMASPVGGSATGWSPGLYVLEARFPGSRSEAWLGLAIRRVP
jgi:hypothetical protein